MVRARWVAVVAAVVALVAAPALSAQANTRDRAADLVVAKTGQLGRLLGPGGEEPQEGVRLLPARSDGEVLRTWMQRGEDNRVRLVSELTRGQSSGLYPGLVPAGMTMRVAPGGSVDIVTGSGAVIPAVDAPWAVDATGKSLRTWYTVEGDGLRQHVDTTGAAYPIVMDPWFTMGWWYVTSVFYIEFSWSETWSLKNSLASDNSAIPALLCGFIPNTAARIACGAVAIAVRADIKATVNAAIANKKCYKARMPFAGPTPYGLAAYDSYYVTCRY
jgi:hypothetical protein